MLTDPRMMGLLTTGLGMMQQSGPSRMPVGVGQAFGNAGMQGLMAARQAQQDRLQQGLLTMQLMRMQQEMKSQEQNDLFRAQIMSQSPTTGSESGIDDQTKALLLSTDPGLARLGKARMDYNIARMPYDLLKPKERFDMWTELQKLGFTEAELRDKGILPPQPAPMQSQEGRAPGFPVETPQQNRAAGAAQLGVLEQEAAKFTQSGQSVPKDLQAEINAAKARTGGGYPTAQAPVASGVTVPPGLSPQGRREYVAGQAAANEAARREVEVAGEKSRIETGAKYAQTAAAKMYEDDKGAYESAKSSARSIDKLDMVLKHLKESDAITGAGQEILLGFEKLKTLLLQSEAAGNRVADTQILDAFLGSDVFPQIKALGIGARGLDTPAEREFLRSVMTGTPNMQKEALIRLTEERLKLARQNVKEFNKRVEGGELDRFFNATGRAKETLETGEPKIKAFKSVEEAERAARRGEIKRGERIIVNGTPGRWD